MIISGRWHPALGTPCGASQLPNPGLQSAADAMGTPYPFNKTPFYVGQATSFYCLQVRTLSTPESSQVSLERLQGAPRWQEWPE